MPVATVAAVGTAALEVGEAVVAAVGVATGTRDAGKQEPEAAVAPTYRAAGSDDAQKGSSRLARFPVVLRVEVASKASAQVFTWIIRLVGRRVAGCMCCCGVGAAAGRCWLRTAAAPAPCLTPPPALPPLPQITALFCGLALSLLSIHTSNLLTVNDVSWEGCCGAALQDAVRHFNDCCRLASPCPAAAGLLQN